MSACTSGSCGALEGLAEQVAGPGEAPAELGGVGRPQEAEGAGLAHRREPGGAVERARGGGVAAAREGVRRRPASSAPRRRPRWARASAAARCQARAVGGGRRVQRLGQRPVGGAPLGRGRRRGTRPSAPAGGGTRAAPASTATSSARSASCRSSGRRAERRGRRQDGVQVARVVGRGRQQRAAGVGAERVGAAAEAPLDGGGRRQRLGDRLVAGQLGVGQQRRAARPAPAGCRRSARPAARPRTSAIGAGRRSGRAACAAAVGVDPVRA